MHTYTISFSGTAYIDAESIDEAEYEFQQQINEVACYSSFEVTE